MAWLKDSNEEGIKQALDQFLSDIKELGDDCEALVAVSSGHANVYTSGLVESPEAFLQMAASLMLAASTSYGWDEEEVAMAGAFLISSVLDTMRDERPDPNLPLS